MTEIPEIEQGLVPTPDGTALCVYKLGDGKQAVILPNAIYLLEHFAWLARTYTVVAYDLRNRGRSPAVSDRALLHRGVHHDVEDLETVREFFKLTRPHLIGHSYLGLMVILYAISHPEQVGRIVQIGASPPRQGTIYAPELMADDLAELAASPAAVELQQARESGVSESDPPAFARLWWTFMRTVLVADPASAEHLGDHFRELPNEWPANLETHLSENVMPSLQRLRLTDDDLGLVAAPVLTIHGRRDRNVPFGAAAEWASRLPDARLLEVTDAAHLPYVESPDIVMPAIRRFLGEAPAQEGS